MSMLEEHTKVLNILDAIFTHCKNNGIEFIIDNDRYTAHDLSHYSIEQLKIVQYHGSITIWLNYENKYQTELISGVLVDDTYDIILGYLLQEIDFYVPKNEEIINLVKYL